MAMQAFITRGEGWAADMIAKQAVTYADALIEALAATAPKSPDESPVPESVVHRRSQKKPRREDDGLVN